jgi:type II secretory pathway pseudopilin PulG
MDSTARPTRAGSARERGFTLAGLIVVMTIMMVFVAYTVPRQWSTILQRERELQTMFVMKQYARAIHEFSRKNNNTFPVSMDQLTKAKLPRYLRAKNG